MITANFNHDGKMDLATANYDSDNISVLLGNGLGSFSAAMNYNIGIEPYTIISADDVDGNIDFAVVNYLSENVSVLLGDGLGNFIFIDNYSVGLKPRSITAADLNGEGIPDLATADFGSVSVLERIGNGNFGPAMTIHSSDQGSFISNSDLNGDGRIDLVASRNGVSAGSGSLEVYLDTTFPMSVNENEVISQDIYPNPTTGEFTIELKKYFLLPYIHIYTCLGALIRNIHPSDKRTIVDLTSEANGLYLNNILNDNRVVFSESILKK